MDGLNSNPVMCEVPSLRNTFYYFLKSVHKKKRSGTDRATWQALNTTDGDFYTNRSTTTKRTTSNVGENFGLSRDLTSISAYQSSLVQSHSKLRFLIPAVASRLGGVRISMLGFVRCVSSRILCLRQSGQTPWGYRLCMKGTTPKWRAL